MLIDSHCHLDRLNLDKYENLDEAVVAAKTVGVEKMLCVCISEENKDAVLSIASKYEGIYASVGVHPSDVKDRVVSIEDIAQWAQAKHVVAVGETGLDYYYTGEYAELQKESFKNHLIAAGNLQLPVIVHTRDARQDTLDLIDQYGNKNSAGVLHCFTESLEMALSAIDLNYYISISGIVTFNSAKALREVVKQLPLERLLVETDSPYLAPVPYRGKPNEPKYVKEVAEFVAELKGVSYEEVCKQTAENFHRLFNKTI